MILVVAVLLLIAGLFVLVMFHAARTMRYVYCSATISAWEARLLPEARLMELVDAQAVAQILAALEDTEYRPKLTEVPREGPIEITAVERALRAGANERYLELLAMVPKERKETIERILGRQDLWNLKAILTAIHNKVPKEERLKELIPSPTMPWERLEMLASAESFEALLEFLRGSEYFDVLSTALEEYKERGLTALLSALDKHYYASLWRDVLAKKAQRDILREVIGYEIDALNIKLILRLKREGVPQAEIEKYMILPSHLLTEAMLKSMAMADDIRSAVGFISHTHYGRFLLEVLPEVEEGRSLLVAEKALDEQHLRLCRWLAITQLFSVAPVLAYIQLKETEVRNLRAVVRLKADEVEPEGIKQMVVRVPRIEL